MTTHNCLTPERHKRSEFKENNSNAKATKYNTNKTKAMLQKTKCDTYVLESQTNFIKLKNRCRKKQFKKNNIPINTN